MFQCFLRSKIKKTLCISSNLITNKYFSLLNNNAKCKYYCKVSSKFIKCPYLFKMLKLHETFLNKNRTFYTSSFVLSSDIPDYLKEVANEVSEVQEKIAVDLDDLDNYMEDELVEYLSSRAVPFDELESSFIVPCPSCGQSDKTRDMFIDKNSGYCVCPSCCLDGKWEDIVSIFDSMENTLTEQQLTDYLCELKPIDESHLSLLSSSAVLKSMNIFYLQNMEAKINDNNSKIVFPLRGENHETVGFASISLQHKTPQVVQRTLEDRSAIFLGLPLPKNKRTVKKVVIVSNIFDALHLAKFKIHSMVLVTDPKEEILNWSFQYFKNVVLWSQSCDVSQSLLNYLSANSITTTVVEHTVDVGSITSLSESKISRLITHALSYPFNSIISFRDIENDVYNRIINKSEMLGQRWTRFAELNSLLLGHRRGELTVFSGPSGSGKTTFMSEYSLDLCMQGVTTLWGSFEINFKRLSEIMLQQYSGKPLPSKYPQFKQLADQFKELPLYFLNIHGQQPIKDVINMITNYVLVKGVRHVVIDNLQFMLGLHGANSDWWLEQDRAVGAFRQFATAHNCHVTLIVHPRKLHNGEKLNLHSISGGARVTQEADNVMIIHVKENKDGSTNLLAPKTLQIAKNRYGGTLGEMRLRFHKESLTLSSFFRSKHSNDIKHSESWATDEETNNDSNVGFKGIPSLFIER